MHDYHIPTIDPLTFEGALNWNTIISILISKLLSSNFYRLWHNGCLPIPIVSIHAAQTRISYHSAPRLLAWASHDLIQLGLHRRLWGLWLAWVGWVATLRQGPSSMLVYAVGIRVSFSRDAVSAGVGTRELCLRGASVRLFELKCSPFLDN